MKSERASRRVAHTASTPPQPADATRIPAGRRRKRPFAWITPELARVLAAAAAWGFAHSVYFLLPAYLDAEVGVGASAIGFVMGSFGLATFALVPWAGRMIDKYPHRDTIRAGALIMAVASLGFLFVDSVGPAMIALRALEALSHALVFTAVGVAVAEIAPLERLSQAVGLAGASMLVMNAVAPAVIEPAVARFGWDFAFLAAFAAAIAGAVFASRIRSRPRPNDDGRDLRLRSVAKRRVVIHYALVVLATGVICGTVFTFEQPFALALGRERVGGFYIAFALAAFGVRLTIGRLPDRLGRRRTGVAMLALYSAAAASLAICRPQDLEAIGFVFGFAHGLLFPSINGIALTAVPEGERGRVMAIFIGVFNLGVASTWVLGAVAQDFGYEIVFLIAASTGVAATALLSVSRPLGKPPHEAPDPQQEPEPEIAAVVPARA
jgi:predicted MFS family arabinose efflux permease